MAVFRVTGGALEVTEVGGEHIWGPTDPRPTPPIVIVPNPPNPPLVIWGGGNVPMPTPPINLEPGEPPLGIWGPDDPRPTPPIVIIPSDPPIIWHPAFPTNPIVIPPQGPGKPPLVIWGGGGVPMPTPPIHLPGDPDEPPEPVEGWDWAYSKRLGWVLVPPGGGGRPQPVP